MSRNQSRRGMGQLVLVMFACTLGCQGIPKSGPMPKTLRTKTAVIANERTLSTVTDSEKADATSRVDAETAGMVATASICGVELQIEQDQLLMNHEVVAMIPPSGSRIELRAVDGRITVNVDGATLHTVTEKSRC